MNNKMKKSKLDLGLTCGIVVVIFAIWTIVTETGLVSAALLPSPKAVGAAFLDISKNGYKGNSLLVHFGASMQRLMLAYLLAIVTAVPLGLFSGFNSHVRALLNPIVEFYRPLPPLAYYTLLVLWMGIGNNSKVALLYLASFAPIYVNCVASVSKVKEDYINAAYTVGANTNQVFGHVILPSCLPDIFTGLRTAMGVAYSTLVAAEMVAAVSGFGWMVLDASNYLRSDIVFVGIIMMGVTGIFLDWLLRFLETKIVPWKGRD